MFWHRATACAPLRSVLLDLFHLGSVECVFCAALKLSAGGDGGGGGKQEKQSLAFEKINEKYTLDCTSPGTWGWAPTDGTTLPSEEVRECCSLPAPF